MDPISRLAMTLKAPREIVEEAMRRFPDKAGATADQIHNTNRQRKNFIQRNKPVDEIAEKPADPTEVIDDGTWTVVKKKVRIKKHKTDEQLEAETLAYLANEGEDAHDSDGNEHNGHLNDIGSRF